MSLVLVTAFSKAQNLVDNGARDGSRVGVNLSVHLAFGTHFQRAGINLQLFYVNGQFQANTVARCYFNLRAPGPKMRYPELALSQGVVFGFGPPADYYNPFYSQVSNQTSYDNAVSYAYNFWINTIRTSQRTGNVAIEIGEAALILENDILAAPTLDRFRTGAVQLQYRINGIAEAALACSMWTGQFGRKQMIEGVPNFHNNCYMDTVGGKYTSISHGMLTAQAKFDVGYSQNVLGAIGADSEHIRNAIQNKFMHNMRFWPERWQKTKNCHIPMIDENGGPYLYRENQVVRRGRLFLNAFTNANLFY